MRQALRALLACGAGFAVSFIAACGGGGGLLSSDQASTLQSQLQAISTEFQSGQCDAVRTDGQGLSADIAAVQGVSPGLRDDLNRLATAVIQSANGQCNTSTTTNSSSSSTSSSSSSTTTTSTTTTPTSTSTTTTSTTTTPTSTSTSTTSSTTGTSTTSSGTSSTGSGGGGL